MILLHKSSMSKKCHFKALDQLKKTCLMEMVNIIKY